MASIGSIANLNIKMSPERARPKIVHHTRPGDNRVWISKIATESPVATLEVWFVSEGTTGANSLISQINSNIGKRVKIVLDNGEQFDSAYMIDYTHRIRSTGSGSSLQYLVELQIQVITDERGS